MEDKELEIKLHYILKEEGIHQMDAKVHNECERQFLLALDVLKAYIGDYRIEVRVPQNGGLIDEFVVLANPHITDFAKMIIAAFFTYYFTKKQNKRDDILKGLEIIGKIKNQSLTKEEALAVVSSDKKLRKIVSNYYKSAENDNQIASIEASTSRGDNQDDISVSRIEKQEFQSHIIETEHTEQTQLIEGTTIAVFSPVLQKGHGKIWNGIYSGKSIPFKIEDKDFLKQVYNNEIKFGSATTIKCNLQITKKEVWDEGDLQKKEDFEYVVKDVINWSDDEHFQNETKCYKKIKEQKRQLDLFSDFS
ncbi:hypothetical protein [uncultured Bacteroides sp.]|uniref:hypothetical protein n=1 Tax=uncultured Bacteroides sp. TaxID=162156 RepID=UPI00262B7428|nr:hypothetical protein [uncultured Bacteroides sp.]